MVIFRTFNDLVLSFIEYIRLVQPDLDTKPGTVSRDLFVDAPAEQLSRLYNDLRNISSLQSFFSANGNDLSRLGSNFGVQRIQGSNATGVAVFTTNSLDVDILIPEGTIVTARNGVTFRTTTTVQMRASNANVFRATATRLRNDLALASITDAFAVEISVEAVTSGTGGNIGRFNLISQNVPGISNITNLETFSGGSNAESDSAFRSRILSVFAGSNTGTVLGYETAVLTVPGVIDVSTVVPGDPLLIRDGTQVVIDNDGNLIVSEPGSGGKVDLYILGTQLESNIDTFIYNDQSGFNDPTDPVNDIILGQQGQETTLNASQRRVELLAADNLPFQPIDSVVTVVGSSSGGNFVEQYIDEDGRTRGNFELIKDEGDFGGSPFGFDRLHFTSNQIELDDEDVTKGIFNGTDALLFLDVQEIRDINQDIFVTNENSTTNTSNRSSIQLLHSPVRTVSRVVNLTTGERYVISDQNPDGTAGELNTTGRILISGNTLPVGTDILQVDYTWVKPYDNIFDFDNLAVRNPFRTVQDSVDWSYSNLVRNEPSAIEEDAYGILTVEVTHNVQRVVALNTFSTETVTASNGAVTLGETVFNVIDMRRVSDDAEVYNTDLANGTLSGTGSVILPTDTLASDGDSIRVRFNANNIFAPDGYEQSTFEDNIITLSSGVTDGYGTGLLVTYVANVRILVPTVEIASLPVLKVENKFNINGEIAGEQPSSNLFISGNLVQNLRRAPSAVRVSAASIGSPGSISVTGTTVHKVEDALLTIVSGNGFDIGLASIIQKDLGVSSLPATVKVAKLESVERVEVDSSGLVTSVDNTYDVVNYKIGDNSFDLGVALEDSSLDAFTVSLPQNTNNTEAILSTADVVRVTFYYTVAGDIEQLFFSRNNVQITDKVFYDINRIALASGFLNAAGEVKGEIVVTNLNQPLDNTTYSVDYDYIAPKENERITITYNTNDVIRDATLVIEDVRPITADVLIKEAEAKDIDLSVRIVLLSEFEDSEQTVVQDAVDSVTTFLNANSLGSNVDASDVVNNLYSVSGIDRVRIINFSTGDSGNVLSISADKNQYLRAGDVDITVEER